MSKNQNQQPTPPLSAPSTGGRVVVTTPNSTPAWPVAPGQGGAGVVVPTPPPPFANRGSERPIGTKR